MDSILAGLHKPLKAGFYTMITYHGCGRVLGWHEDVHNARHRDSGAYKIINNIKLI